MPKPKVRFYYIRLCPDIKRYAVFGSRNHPVKKEVSDVIWAGWDYEAGLMICEQINKFNTEKNSFLKDMFKCGNPIDPAEAQQGDVVQVEEIKPRVRWSAIGKVLLVMGDWLTVEQKHGRRRRLWKGKKQELIRAWRPESVTLPTQE